MKSHWMPWYRLFGVAWCTCDGRDVWIKKLGTTWKFCFCLSMCENAMGSTLWAHRTHMQFHSLIHTLAGLNEIQHVSVQFQHLLHPSWLLRPPQCTNEDGRSKEASRNKPPTGTQTAEAVHQSLVLGNRKEISKVAYVLQAELFLEMESFQSRRHDFGRPSNLDFWADVDDLRRLCIRTQ